METNPKERTGKRLLGAEKKLITARVRKGWDNYKGGIIMKLRKSQLQKIWKQLDGSLEAMERLGENDIDVFDEYHIDESAIVLLRDKVGELIESKTRKAK